MNGTAETRFLALALGFECLRAYPWVSTLVTDEPCLALSDPTLTITTVGLASAPTFDNTYNDNLRD